MRKTKVKSELLSGRYALKSNLFASDLGYLYHARDTQSSSPTSLGLPVLVHFLPGQIISSNDVLTTLLEHLKKVIKTLNYPILPVIDYGWNGTEVYVVMAAPESWSIKVLSELPSTPSSLHKTAMKISSDLHKNGHISRGLTPQAFLVIPGGLELLGTALMEPFQLIQPERNLLPPLPTPHKNRVKRVATLLSLTTLTGAVLAGSYSFYSQQAPKELMPYKSVPLSVQKDTPAIFLDHPLANSPEVKNSTPYSLSKAIPDKNSLTLNEEPTFYNTHKITTPPGTLQLALRTKPNEDIAQGKIRPSNINKINNNKDENLDIATKSKKFQFAKPPANMELPTGFCTLNSPKSCKPATNEIKFTEKVSLPTPINISADDEGKKLTRAEFRFPKLPVDMKPPQNLCDSSNTKDCKPQINEVTLAKQLSLIPDNTPAENTSSTPAQTQHQLAKTPKQIATTKPRLTANGLNSEQLKNKAYAALSSGALGEKPNVGSIFYIRLLKRIDAKNPHIRRLARGVASAYHTQARQKIKQQQKQDSRRLLWMAEKVIKEFNLTKMNQTHAMLKHRQSE